MRLTLFPLSLCLTLLCMAWTTPSHAWRLKALPEGYQQVDLVQLQTQFYQQYPTTNVFGFVSKSNKGVKVNREGKIEYRTPGMLRTSRGWVREYTPEHMCFTYDLAPKWWTCVSMYRNGSEFICHTEVKGRNSSWYWKCGPKAFPRRRM